MKKSKSLNKQATKASPVVFLVFYTTVIVVFEVVLMYFAEFFSITNIFGGFDNNLFLNIFFFTNIAAAALIYTVLRMIGIKRRLITYSLAIQLITVIVLVFITIQNHL